jgi:hypothetical protein
MENYYNQDYFDSEIFIFDYGAIAKEIVLNYNPKNVIEFGCGGGALAKELSLLGVKVLAIDGFSNPDFSNYNNIDFIKIDLNNVDELRSFVSNASFKYDVAISTEVAEHLLPIVSGELIKSMTSVSEVVVFSAAVPMQGGDGHINCRSRLEWHNEFVKCNFQIVDTLRQNFRFNNKLGLWHKLNIIDYVSHEYMNKNRFDFNDLVDRLIEAESFAASQAYFYERKNQISTWALSLQPIKSALLFRNYLTKVFGKTTIDLN